MAERKKIQPSIGGLRRLEAEAAEAVIRRLREAAYPLNRGKKRKLVLARLGQDLARVEKSLGYTSRLALDKTRERGLERVHNLRSERVRSKTA